MRLLKRILIALAVYLAVAGVFFLIVHQDWSRSIEVTDPVNKDALLQALSEETEIRQTFAAGTDQIVLIRLQAEAADNLTEHRVEAAVLDGETVLYSASVFPAEDGSVCLDLSDRPIEQKGRRLTLSLKSSDGVSFWYGTTRSAGKFSVNTVTEELLTVQDKNIPGELVMQITGVRNTPYTRYYWPVAAVIGVLIVSIICYVEDRRKKGKKCTIITAEELISRYAYLMKTLVSRDFKVRYKASVLGMLWSFLNPLLMTFVYLVVFSTLFQSSIPHFPIYLMSGIILFNYVSEATTLGMQSIVGNAGLITKVYLPKYVFPISKAVSSSINLFISMIPLLIMMLLTGVEFRISLLLMPLVAVFLIAFCVGIGLMLSSCMVFFRDIQFLWSILLTILNFFSPIFYPESIIPAQFIKLYHLNPLYQYLYFMRTIVINGISPNPQTYLYCSLASLIALAAGILIFRKTQHRFVLYL